MWQLNPWPLLFVSHRTEASRSLLRCQTSRSFNYCGVEAAASSHSALLRSSQWGSGKVKVFSSASKSWSAPTWKAWGTPWWYKACVIRDLPPPVCTTKASLLTRSCCSSLQSASSTGTHAWCVSSMQHVCLHSAWRSVLMCPRSPESLTVDWVNIYILIILKSFRQVH